ncbi:DUF6220 domain-containing protein [Halococcus sp. IIIV-5B]|uniref:DUF6220 domain-containing protein n=1 Tax=Halococcus sp. IIIV-5B TaxID=2321230 RepID=UPI000E75D4A1|nr:DUF6220 domain-containing protein [Halococcus sp. IIIV-5B]RJT07113.1 hypothetical protein D3261_03650 [Halococcus sp. IIIV-5B]
MAAKRVVGAQYGYFIAAGLFFAGVLLQTYIAGMAVFIDPEHWELHTSFVHLIEVLLLPMLVFGYVGQLPRLLIGAPFGLFILIGIQYMTAGNFGSLVSAIHPVNAIFMSILTLWMAKESWERIDTPL